MAADTLPVMSGVLRDQRRSLTLWGLALAAVSAMYISFYPAMGGAEMDALSRICPRPWSPRWATTGSARRAGTSRQRCTD